MEEPSVLDYVLSKIFFWRKQGIQIPPSGIDDDSRSANSHSLEYSQSLESKLSSAITENKDVVDSTLKDNSPGYFWSSIRILFPLILALFAQLSLEPPGRSVITGIILYSASIVWFIWIFLKGEWILQPSPELHQGNIPVLYKSSWIWITVLLSLISFLLFTNNNFNKINVLLWFLAFLSFLFAFWIKNSTFSSIIEKLRKGWNQFLLKGITISKWTILVIGVFLISAFFRFYLLDQVPAEMFSDHAEKLIDVSNVLQGQTNIFFPRNTGREAFQIYLTAAVASVFNTGLTFISLKIGTVLCGLFTLPFIYLLGKEIANKEVGLYSMFFAGIAYWPNVISRVALRFTLFPTFFAPMLYFLLRGLRGKNRNDFIISGIFLGIGLHGYSPFRFVPIVVVVLFFIYILHQKSRQDRLDGINGLVMISSVSLIIFLPLLRYVLDNPQIFSYRMMTRMGQVERDFPGSPVGIFFSNLGKALIMPIWDDGQIWVHSIPGRPALGVVSAALFVLGVVILLFRYFKYRNWVDLFLIVSIPLLMMPSILSLAFPEENPSLNRTGGALILVFLVVGMAFDGFLKSVKKLKTTTSFQWIGWVVGLCLIVVSIQNNYSLVFEQYAEQFMSNAWNTSEIGAVVRQFADTIGFRDSVWVVPYPYWVDTRLVGIRAGFPDRDYALWSDDIIDTINDPRPKMYIFKPEDSVTEELLQDFYPNGSLDLYQSHIEGKDFYVYYVPPTD